MKTMRRITLLLLVFVVMITVPASAENTSANAAYVNSMLKIAFSAIDCDCIVYGNSSGYVVQFSSEDYSAMYLMSLLISNDDTDEMMEGFTDSVVGLCSELRKNIESLGVENPNLTLMLTDNIEKDYVYYLIVYNGQVIYDMLAN